MKKIIIAMLLLSSVAFSEEFKTVKRVKIFTTRKEVNIWMDKQKECVQIEKLEFIKIKSFTTTDYWRIDYTIKFKIKKEEKNEDK